MNLQIAAHWLLQSNWSLTAFAIVSAISIYVLFRMMQASGRVMAALEIDPKDPDPTNTFVELQSSGRLEQLKAERDTWLVRAWVALGVMTVWSLALMGALNYLEYVGAR